jgi:hypothetical protein
VIDWRELIERKPVEVPAPSYVHRIKDDPLDMEELENFRNQDYSACARSNELT